MLNKASYDLDNMQTNIVHKDKLKQIQSKTLSIMKDAIICSMGPAGSNTLILKGDGKLNVEEYSKDGNKIISNIKFQNPIEQSIQSQVETATKRVEKKVGDGTSSIVVLSSIIFDLLLKAEQEGRIAPNPYQVMRDFQTAVNTIKEEILSHKRDCTLEDIYNISLISTNGNADLADSMVEIYKDFGMNVFIDVSASLDEKNETRDYNGLTIDCGYSDHAFVNTNEGISRIINPRIYAFEDPVDSPEMINYFDKILRTNILENFNNPEKWIPTVIMAPKISRDMAAQLRKLVDILNTYAETNYTQKPPILIVTNIFGISVNHYDHITSLCGCKKIRKYIDVSIQKKDQESGLAPTLDNVADFYGTAELVEADALITKFKSPDLMYEKIEITDDDGKTEIQYVVDDDGKAITSKTYDSLINALESQLKRATTDNDVESIGSLQRQLNSLRANMVEFFVGGLSMIDREAAKDLVEDAVLNCRSAAANGVGFGANYEGYRAVSYLWEKAVGNYGDLVHPELTEYYDIIASAYHEILNILYSTVLYGEELANVLDRVMDCEDGPYNISTQKFDGKVLTSIMSDVTILDIISKIITIMFTSNQALIQAPQFNLY